RVVKRDIPMQDHRSSLTAQVTSCPHGTVDFGTMRKRKSPSSRMPTHVRSAILSSNRQVQIQERRLYWTYGNDHRKMVHISSRSCLYMSSVSTCQPRRC